MEDRKETEITPQALKIATKSSKPQHSKNISVSPSIVENTRRHDNDKGTSTSTDFVQGSLISTSSIKPSNRSKYLTPLSMISDTTPLQLPPTDKSHDLDTNSEVTVILHNITSNFTVRLNTFSSTTLT